MSRRRLHGPLEPLAPIPTKGVDKRLGAIIRRHGGTPRSVAANHRLPDPPRGECGGQLDLFDPEQYVPYELRRGRLG